MKITVIGTQNLIHHISGVAAELIPKRRELMEKLAQIGIDVATVRFSTAQYDGTNDVQVGKPVWVSDNTLEIRATGNAVCFIEFGTGVHYTEQHPKANDMGMIRGAYGHGLGKNDTWRYKGEAGTNGEVIRSGAHEGEILTHGNPPARAMYEAGKEMHSRVEEVAREVFR